MDRAHDMETRISVVFAGIFLLIVIGGVVDLVLDRPTRLSAHVAFEVLMVLVSSGAAAYLARGWLSAQQDLRATREEADRQREARLEWEERAAVVLEGLGQEVARQFEDWSLTPTEKKVALMLLKGHSHKKMAKITGTSERTVRQHSVAVYRKAGLAGRAELAGFFLDALVLPDELEGAAD